MFPGSEFDNPILLEGGQLKLSGPYNTGIEPGSKQELVGDVVIRYLVFADGPDDAPVVKVDRAKAFTPRKDGRPDVWTDIVPANGLRVGDRIRAVGVAVQTTKYDDDARVPPSIASITWCVNRKVVADTERLLADVQPSATEPRPLVADVS